MFKRKPKPTGENEQQAHAGAALLPEIGSALSARESSFTVPLPITAAGAPIAEDRPSSLSSSPSKAPIDPRTPRTSFHRPSSTRSPDPLPHTEQNSSASPPLSRPVNESRAASQRRSIASLYPSPISGPHLTPRGTLKPPALPTGGRRRAHRAPPPLNIVVVGARNAGKTSWIGTLLGNVELSGGKRERAEAEQRIKQFGEGVVEIGPPSTKTADMRSITVEVMEGDQKTSLTLLDSVGWESPAGRSSEVYDLEMERQLGHVMDEVEKRFDETLNAENQLVRTAQRGQESHVNLALYFLHPDTFVNRRSGARRWGTYSLSQSRSTSHLSDDKTQCQGQEQESQLAQDRAGKENGGIGSEEFGMSEMDLGAIERLSQRVNVVPVIGRSDTLTISQLASVKAIVNRDLRRAGLNSAIFDADPLTEVGDSLLSVIEASNHPRDASSASSLVATSSQAPEPLGSPIKLKRNRSTARLGRSKSTAALLSSEAVDVEQVEEGSDEAPAFCGESLARLQPFALVSPEGAREGEWIRKFRFGTVDILNLEHCDFSPLKQAIFGSAKVNFDALIRYLRTPMTLVLP